jgi:hypothetical protein
MQNLVDVIDGRDQSDIVNNKADTRPDIFDIDSLRQAAGGNLGLLA